MSQRNIGINFSVNAQELKQLEKAIQVLDNFNKKTSKVAQEVGKVSQSFDQQASSAGKANKETIDYSKAMQVLDKHLQKQTSSMKSIQRVQDQLNKKLEKYGKNAKVTIDDTGKITGQFKDLNGQIIKVTGKYDKLNNEIKGFKTQIITTNNVVDKARSKSTNLARANQELANQIANTRQRLNNQSNSMDSLARSYNRLHSKGIELTRVITRNKGKFDVYNTSVLKNTKIVEANIDSQGKFTQKLVTANGKLHTITGYYDRNNQRLTQYSHNVKEATERQRRMADVQDVSTRRTGTLADSMAGLNKYTLSWAEAIQISLTRMVQWSVAATAIFGTQRAFRSTLDVIIEVDTRMTELIRVMNEDTNFQSMIEGSIELAKELGQTISDIQKAMVGFARQGFNEQEVINMANTSTIMSNVSELKADEAMERLTSAMVQFGVEAENSMAIVDRFNEVDMNYAITTKKLAEAVSKSGATAKAYGVELEELIGLTTAIGVATRESGSIVGNSLKTIFSRLSMSASKSALKEIGIEVEDFNGEARRATDILNELSGEWDDLSAKQQQNLGVTLAGRYQLSRFLALMNNYQMALDSTATASDSYGSAMKENEKYMRSIQAQINILKAKFQELAYEIGESGLTDALKLAISTGQVFAAGLTSLTKAFGAFNIVTLAIVGTIGVLTFSYKKLIKDQAMLIQTGAAVHLQTARLGMQFGMTATQATALGMATNSLATSLRGLALSMVANPMTWILTALTVIPLVIGHVNKLKKEHEDLISAVEETEKSYSNLQNKMYDGSLDKYDIDLQKVTAATKMYESQLSSLNKRYMEFKKMERLSGKEGYGQRINGVIDLTEEEKNLSKQLGVTYTKYKTYAEWLSVVKTKGEEYEDALNKANTVTKENEKAVLLTSNSYKELNGQLEENVELTDILFGINNKLLNQHMQDINAIKILNNVESKSVIQKDLYEQALTRLSEKYGISQQAILDNIDTIGKEMEAEEKLLQAYNTAAEGIISDENARMLAQATVATNNISNMSKEAKATSMLSRSYSELAKQRREGEAAYMRTIGNGKLPGDAAAFFGKTGGGEEVIGDNSGAIQALINGLKTNTNSFSSLYDSIVGNEESKGTKGSSGSGNNRDTALEIMKDKFQSVLDKIRYLESVGITSYQRFVNKVVSEGREFVKTGDDMRSYNKQLFDLFSNYKDMDKLSKDFNVAKMFGNPEDVNKIFGALKEIVKENITKDLKEKTEEWLDKFNSGLSEANDKVKSMIKLHKQLKSEIKQINDQNFINDYISKQKDSLGLNEQSLDAVQQIKDEMSGVMEEIESKLGQNGNIKLKLNGGELDARLQQLREEYQKINDKLYSETQKATWKGLDPANLEHIKQLNEQWEEMKKQIEELEKTKIGLNNTFDQNDTKVKQLTEQYKKLQEELKETEKRVNILNTIKEKVNQIFDWNANSLLSEKTDEYGNAVRDIEGTIQKVFDVQKAISEVTSDIYGNIENSVNEMLTSIITSDMDIGDFLNKEADYSGIANGIGGAVSQVEPVWNGVLDKMSGSMLNMFSETNFDKVAGKWAIDMSKSMEQMKPLFENLLVKFPESVAKLMEKLPDLINVAMNNIITGVFNAIINVLNQMVSVVNRIAPEDQKINPLEYMNYATPTYTQNNESKQTSENKTYQANTNVQRNVTYVVNTGVALASEGELREFAVLLSDMIKEEEGRGNA